jgi:hypothetical protein
MEVERNDEGPGPSIQDEVPPLDSSPAYDPSIMLVMANVTTGQIPSCLRDRCSGTLEEAQLDWAGHVMSSGSLEEFRALFARDHILSAYASGTATLPFRFDMLQKDGSHRSMLLTMRLMSEGPNGDVLCVSTLEEQPEVKQEESAAPPQDKEENYAIIKKESSELIKALVQERLADLEMDAEFDRKEIKTKYRRVSVFLVILVLFLGLGGGIGLYRSTPWLRDYVESFFPASATPDPNGELAAALTEETQKKTYDPVYVPYKQASAFTAEILPNGAARTYASSASYTSIECSLELVDLLTPSYYADKYAKKYSLTGSEACAVFALTVSKSTESEDADSEASELDVFPQEAFKITMAGPDGQTVEEYQLMDSEIAGAYNVSVKTGKEKTFYKRFSYSSDIAYMIVTYYANGEAHPLYFALAEGDKNVTYETLEKGAKSEAVKTMQKKLVALKYMSRVSGVYDTSTINAVKAAQKAFGLTQSGVADDAFLHKLLDTQ